MCNINVILNKKKKDAKISECMNVVSFNSYLSNNHAEGYIDEKLKITKSVNKLIYSGTHDFIVSHQRIATSGKVPEMDQPLESSNFIIAHNGVFSSLGTDKESDTWHYLQKLEKEYESEKDIVKMIQNVSSTLTGTYSVVLVDKNTKEMYYYKESGTSMYALYSEDYVFMSTKKDNVHYMQKYFGQFKEEVFQVDAYKIYNLRDFSILGEFTEKKYSAPTYIYPKKSNYITNTHVITVDTHEKVKAVLDYHGIGYESVGVHSLSKTIICLHAEDIALFVSLFDDFKFLKIKQKGVQRCLMYEVDTVQMLQEYDGLFTEDVV